MQEKRGRPNRTFLDVMKEDMQWVGVTEEDAGDRVRWKQTIYCGGNLKRETGGYTLRNDSWC